MPSILKHLAGGDRRSIGRSNEIAEEVLKRPVRIGELFSGLSHFDAVVRMRAADALEKVSVRRPELLQPYRLKLLAIAGSSEQQEVRWHAALMIPRLKLTVKDRAVAVDILFDYLRDRSSIVKTCAMRGLANLVCLEHSLAARILPRLEELTQTGTPAMRAQGRKLLQELNRQRAKA